jgi:hypothetical protein
MPSDHLFAFKGGMTGSFWREAAISPNANVT